MQIFLIRHTRPLVAPGTCYGQSDVTLHEEGIARMNDLLVSLQNHRFDAVFSSPLVRCSELAKRIDSSFVSDERLLELHFGAWELQKWSTINDEEMKWWCDDYAQHAVPGGGESFNVLSQRVLLFWNELMKTNYSKVAIVTHAGVIRALLSHFLSIPLNKVFLLQLYYGQIIRIKKINDDNFSVDFTDN